MTPPRGVHPARGVPPAKPTLHIEGTGVPRNYQEGDRITIGRDGSHNDITFSKDNLISRTHARIVFQRNGDFVGRVTDLESQNGTRVIRDGVTISVPAAEPFAIKAGDIILIGHQRIFVGKPPRPGK